MLNFDLGFSSSIAWLPWDNIGIAVFSNDNELGTLLVQSITYHLFDEALGLAPIDWSSRCVCFLHVLLFFDSNMNGQIYKSVT